MWADIAQSVQRRATGWTVRVSNPGGGDVFLTRSVRPWGSLIPLYIGITESFPGIQRPERDLTTHTHVTEEKVRVELYLFPLCDSLACYRATCCVRLLWSCILLKNKQKPCWSCLFLWTFIFKNLLATKHVMPTESRSSFCPLKKINCRDKRVALNISWLFLPPLLSIHHSNSSYTGLFETIVGVLTTCNTQQTSDSSMQLH